VIFVGQPQSQKTLSFTRDESAGTRTLIKPQGDTIVVSAASGLDRSAGPKKREKAKKPDRNIRQITRAAGGAHGMAVIARAKAQHNYTARNARELSFKVTPRPLFPARAPSQARLQRSMC
jgi:hypothetical protein